MPMPQVGVIKNYDIMKKIFMTLAAVAAFSFANAQIFVGGSLGISTSSSRTNTSSTSGTSTIEGEYKGPSNFDLLAAPKVGFYLNDKLAVGLGLGINHFSETEYDYIGVYPAVSEYTMKNLGTEFGIIPFVRYHFAEWNNFSLFGELNVGMLFGSSKDIEMTANTELITEGPKAFAFNVSVTPGVAYKINDHIQLEAMINLLGLNYIYNKITQVNDNISSQQERVTRESEFEFGADSKNAFNVGNLTIGFVYKF